MSNLGSFDEYDDEGVEVDGKAFQEKVFARFKAAGINYELLEDYDSELAARFKIPAGDKFQWVYCLDDEDYERLEAISFEDYVCLDGFDAICDYKNGQVEAGIKVLSGGNSRRNLFTRIFGQYEFEDDDRPLIQLNAIEGQGELEVQIGEPSLEFMTLAQSNYQLTIKVTSEKINQQDRTKKLLSKISDAVFFQIDILNHLALSLARERKVTSHSKKDIKNGLASLLSFPANEYDSAPLSLYWYARSAVGMPLLQFLAFYQVIEFYYPTYSQAEAKKKIGLILKDPAFRGDRDADLGRLLSTIHVTRSGGYGDERSQLKATIMECLDDNMLHDFITSDGARKSFLTDKKKGLAGSRISLIDGSIRQSVSERIYEIRCKIVHTKTDAKNGEFELLLPFSKEAEELSHDIELVQHVAQKVLIAASSSFKFDV
ncbi:hypothetical protein GTP58_28920 [Duganella sp. CY15W]|uniref:hypothetical protein n=1 Tax=Duganella sp. CY15W TaxID=2692172 RepID=UPI001370C707|nr:hypothetical protein [Duganella sp. CY15W]MYM32361.1 hypothetical protein [Duganella sp. CY15W]